MKLYEYTSDFNMTKSGTEETTELMNMPKMRIGEAIKHKKSDDSETYVA